MTVLELIGLASLIWWGLKFLQFLIFWGEKEHDTRK